MNVCKCGGMIAASEVTGYSGAFCRCLQPVAAHASNYGGAILMAHKAEIDSLRQQITELQKKCRAADEVIEFYADIDSWNSLLTESIKYHRIELSDVGDGEYDNGHGTDDNGVGGKRARQFQKDYPATSAQDAR